MNQIRVFSHQLSALVLNVLYGFNKIVKIAYIFIFLILCALIVIMLHLLKGHYRIFHFISYIFDMIYQILLLY